MNHFKSNLATQIRVDRLVGDTHGASAEFYWHAIIISDQLILVEAVRFGGEIDIFAGQSRTPEFLAKFEPRFAGARRAASWKAGLKRLRAAA